MQNQKRHWLNVGVGFVGIGVFLYVVGVLFNDLIGPIATIVFILPPFVFSTVTGTNIFGSNSGFFFNPNFFGYIFSIVILFALGSIAGWIYGKFKNRKT